VLAIAVVVALVGIALPALGASRVGEASVASATTERASEPAAAPVNLTVDSTDQPSFVPSVLAAPPGVPLHILVTNVGKFNHTFTLSQQANFTLPQNWTPSQVYQHFAANPPWANVTLLPGKTGQVNITTPANSSGDRFEFLSVIPFQFQAGMYGFLRVNLQPVGPPVNLTEQATNALLFVPAVLGVETSVFPVAVHVAVSNLGNVGHTWTLSPLPGYNLSSTNYTTFFQAHPPLADAAIPSAVGGVVWANFTVLGKGVYQYICTVPGHFSAGMYGYLYVGVPVPTQSAPSTEIIQVGVLAGAAVLLGAGIVLAVVASLSGRFRTSPPPPSH